MQELTPTEVAGRPLIDVREQDEWDAGHAESAVHIPMGEIADRISEVPAGAAIICKLGGRSARVVEYLEAQGLDVVNVTGGTVAWAEAKLPMTGTV